MSREKNIETAIRMIMDLHGLTHEEAEARIKKAALAIALVAAKKADEEVADAAFAETLAERRRKKLN